MTNRIPLIVNSGAAQIQELAPGDNLDLNGGSLVNVAGVEVSSLSVSGNVTADYFHGDGSQLTNLPIGNYSNANVTAFLPTYTGNLHVEELVATGLVYAANIQSASNVSGDYFFGNGAFLTGLPAGYSNADVEAYLPSDPTIISIWGSLDDTNSNVANTDANVANLVAADSDLWAAIGSTNSNVANTDGNVATVASDLDILELTVSEISSNVAALFAEDVNLWAAIGNVNANVASTDSNVSNLWTALANTDSNVASINDNLGVIWNDQLAQWNDIANINSNVANTDANVANLVIEDANIWAAIGNSSSSFADLTSALANTNSNVSNTNSNVANTNSNVSTLSSALSSTDSNVASLVSNLANTDSNVATINSNLADTDSNVASLWSSLADTNSNLANTDANVVSTDSNVANLVSDLANTNSNVTVLQGNIVTIQGNIANLTSAVLMAIVEAGEAEANTGVLFSMVANTNANVANTDSNVSALSNSVVTIEGNIATLTSDLANTNSNVSTLSNTVFSGFDEISGAISNIEGNIVNLQAEAYSNANAAAYLAVYAGNVLANVVTANLINTIGNLDVGGNLNVIGNIVSNDVSELVVGDPLIYLGANNSGDIFDLGFVASYNDGTYEHTGLARNAVDNTWTFFDGVVAEPTTVIDWANATYPAVKAGDFLGESLSVIGNVTGSYIIGNGALLTGMPAGYGNADLANIGANTISTTGNITGGSLLADGVYSTIETIVGNSANTTTAKLRLTVEDSNTFIQVGNGTSNTSGNIVFSRYLQATPSVTINTTVGTISAVGAISTAGALSATGLVTGSGLRTAGTVSATGNITGGNLITAGTLSVTGNTTAGNINAGSVTGYIQLADYTATGTHVTYTFFDLIYPAPFAVGQTLQVAGSTVAGVNGSFYVSACDTSSVTVVSVMPAGSGTLLPGGPGDPVTEARGVDVRSISITGNVTAGYFFGDGSLLTNLPAGYSNSNVANYLPTYTGALAAGNITTTGRMSAVGNVTAGNITTTGKLSVTGNTTAGNINVGSATGYTDLASYTATGTQVIFSFGTFVSISPPPFTAGQILEVRGSNVAGINGSFAVAACNNVSVTVSSTMPAGSGDLSDTITEGRGINIRGISATGNVTAGYFIGDGSQLTGLPASYSNADVANYLPTYSGNINGLSFASANALSGNATLNLNGNGLTGLFDTTGNISLSSSGNAWVFEANGAITLPTIETGSTIGNVPTLVVGTGTNQVAIVGPEPIAGDTDNAPRLNLVGRTGLNSGEGGDIYVLGGEGGPSDGSGGDIRIRGGYAPGAAIGGTVQITGGDSSTSEGGYVRITAGDGLMGAPVEINAGQGSNVETSGNVEISTISGTWTFNNIGELVGPGNLILSNGYASVIGNVYADYIVGNGAMLTGLPATYSNADVAAYLETFTGNISSDVITANSIVTQTAIVSEQTTANTIILGNAAVSVSAFDWVSTQSTSTTPLVMWQAPISTIASVDFNVTITSEGTNERQVTQIIAIAMNTDYSYNEYGSLRIGNILSDITVDSSGGNLRLVSTPATTDTLDYTVVVQVSYDMNP